MIEPMIEPVTLVGRLVRLEPLGWRHRDGLVASGLDPELYLVAGRLKGSCGGCSTVNRCSLWIGQ